MSLQITISATFAARGSDNTKVSVPLLAVLENESDEYLDTRLDA